MSYPGRISLALAVSCGVVTTALALMPRVLRRIEAVAVLAPVERPVFVDLRRLAPEPPRPEPAKRLVDSGAIAEGPVKETDLISSQASQAQDLSDLKGDPSRAAAKEVDEFDQLGTPPPPASPPAPEPGVAAPIDPAAAEKSAEADAVAPAPESPAQEKPSTTEMPVKKDAGVVVAPAVKAAEGPVSKPVAEAAAKREPQPERFQVAAAPPSPPSAPQVPVQELRAEKGREGGGAEQSGFTSFEANKHVLGEYMIKVRNRVEREWRTALHLRYSGVSRTAATIRCVIRPDGTIESVSILDPGDSLTYSVLCRDAVERAGPFGPFPFDVPEIYKSENLEINWKFSYL